MKKVLLVCAMPKESKRIAERLNLEQVEENVWKKDNVTLLISGIGKQRTAISLTKYFCEHEKVDLIVNIGYAGSTNVPIGKWVNIEKSYNYEWFIPGEEKFSFLDVGNKPLTVLNNDSVEKYDCYSAESFVTKTDINKSVAFDMELHSVVVAGEMFNIPVMALKKISDNLSIDEYYKQTETNANVFELDSSVDLLKDIISK